MNSYNLSVPLIKAIEVRFIFFAGSCRESFAPSLSRCLMCWSPGMQSLITAKAQFSMFGMAHIDLFGPGRSRSNLAH